MRKHVLHRLAAVAALLFLNLSTWTASAEWTSAGVPAGRTSRVEEEMGPIMTPPLWQIGPTEPNAAPGRHRIEEFGSSAAQPVAITEDGQTVLYHLAGRFLWRATVSQRGEIGEVRWVDNGKPMGVPVNPSDTTPASTPTYSPESQMLYFGTNDGKVYGYSITRKNLRPFQIYEPTDNCRFIASPLVLHVTGADGAQHDVVVIGDRPASDGTLGNCGHLWVVWGLDGPSPDPMKKSYSPSGSDPDEKLRGWITPSPLQVPGTNDQFIIGADAAAGCTDADGSHGKAMKFAVKPAPGGDFDLERVKGWQSTCQQGSNGPVPFGGFAGSFAADAQNVYWNDTRGYLWGAQLTNGQKPGGWAEGTLYLPALVDGATPSASGFTNTRPAVGQDAIYVTLRNYLPILNNARLRENPVGSSGALVAVTRGGQKLWAKPLPDALSPYRNAASTDPLILQSSGLVLFGDVNGNLRAYSLEGGEPATLLVDPACQAESVYSLLAPGERPLPGARNYSQTFGTSITPTALERLIVTGVNGTSSAQPDGFNRLVGLKVRQTYNLGWSETTGAEPIKLSATPSNVGAGVFLQVAESPFLPPQPVLADLRPEGVKVSWFAVDRAQWDGWLTTGAVPGAGELVAVFLGQTDLPGDLPGFGLKSGVVPPGRDLGRDVTALPDLPRDGYIVGVIDLERLATGGIGRYKAMAARLAQVGGGTGANCSAPSWEMAQRPDPAGASGFISALADNFLPVPYQVAQAADVTVSLVVGPLEGGELPGMVGTPATAYITLTGHVAQPFTGLLGLTVAWPGQPVRALYYAAHTLTLDQPQITVTVPFLVAQPEAWVTVEAFFNLPPVAAETDYTNNVARLSARTGSLASPTIAPGSSRVIIVPADCIPETDPTTGRLCKNYAKSLDDW